MENKNYEEVLKRGRIQPFEVCEYQNKCGRFKYKNGIINCNGLNKNREYEFRCAIRRYFLIEEKYL